MANSSLPDVRDQKHEPRSRRSSSLAEVLAIDPRSPAPAPVRASGAGTAQHAATWAHRHEVAQVRLVQSWRKDGRLYGEFLEDGHPFVAELKSVTMTP